MAIAYGERDTSPELALDSATTRYWVTGETDESVVTSTLLADLPVTLAGLTRTNIRIEPLGSGMWDAEITYSLVVQSTSPQPGQPTFSFDTGGGTQHITQSLGMIASQAPAGMTAPNFKGAIGVTADSVEGVDIVVPVYQFSETHVLPNTTVTDAYKRTLMQITGKVNSDVFRGFPAGEVLFLGASGTRRGTGDWEITFRFASSENKTGIAVGDIAGIVKKGWEYLWARYEEAEDAASLTIVKQPVAAYVEKVYTDTAFSALGI